jgi:flagellar biosynthesis component FlhA
VGSNMGAAALVIVGVVLVFLGLFAGGGNVPIILIGVVALIAAGTLQAIGMRRG